MELVKSKQRVADHGEVFTPHWMVEAMLDLVKEETERIDSRFLEPACGTGNFLVPVLRRKLAAVELRFGKTDFEKRHYALLALMCIYGIELLADNVAECRENLLEIFAEYLGLDESDELYRAAAVRARAEHRPRRCAHHADQHSASRSRSPSGPTSARAGSSGATSVRHPHADVGLQRGGHALRRARQARDLHPDAGPTRP